MKLAWYLPTLPSVKWKIATQLGVEYAVAGIACRTVLYETVGFQGLCFMLKRV